MSDESFEMMLTGGHLNSLGRTVEVVEIVLADPARLAELYACYGSDDAVVRLRTSSGIKRISRVKPEWLVPYIDRLLTEVAALDQASAQWTLADLFATLAPLMSATQRNQAEAVLKRNLANHTDWIVLNQTMKTLGAWAKEDAALRHWLVLHLERLSGDGRKSVAKTAQKTLNTLT
ncbi:hypothetical protein MNBD_CHLOROFLEXI01-2778 [hydrothermal vent metagenome]|uniref:DNA alkylation repair enzyme n=1 Tax=hydrothermal vent metagenome TaxID=652676 RepID=A0A3B0VIK3_9ZZZZ